MLKKRTLLLSAIAGMLLTHASADNRGGYNYSERNVDKDKNMSQKQSNMDRKRSSSRQKMDQTTETTITPDAGPRVSNGVDLFLTADFIYWSVRKDGLAFAETGTTTGLNISSANATKGTVYHPKFRWEPGFKVGLGLDLNHDGWDIYAQYTWLRTHPPARTISRDRNNLPLTNALKGTWVVQGIDVLVQDLFYASARWKHRLNVLDLELGRNFYISRFLTLRPHAGFKGTWQDNDLSVTYRYASGSVDDSQTKMKNNIDYWGLGIRTGFNNAWYFMRNFCLFGDIALTALWGRFDIDRKDYVDVLLSIPDDTFINRNQRNRFYTLKAVLELAIGLRYDVWWSNDNYHFGFQAGWEEQVWYSQNQHYKPTEEGAHGDLVFQGLTVKVRFDF